MSNSKQLRAIAQNQLELSLQHLSFGKHVLSRVNLLVDSATKMVTSPSRPLIPSRRVTLSLLPRMLPAQFFGHGTSGSQTSLRVRYITTMPAQ